MTKYVATARATVTVEVRDLGCWGEDTKMQQIHKQAADAALGKLRQVFSSEVYKFRIFGEPKVTVVLVEEES